MLSSKLVDEAVNKSGGRKNELQRMVLNGHIDQLTATLAAMRINRIQEAAKLDQLEQPTVAEQVMNPQPQMPPQAMAAIPQAQQMPPQAQMGRPAPQPQMPPQPMPQQMAMGGGLDAIPYNEGSYAPGGVVSFNEAGSVKLTKEQLEAQLQQAYMNAGSAQERAQIQAQLDNIKKMGTVTSPGGQAVTDSRLNQDASFTGAAPLAEAQLASPEVSSFSRGLSNEGDIARAEAILGKTRVMNPQERAESAPVDASDPMAIGMETFADGMVSRPDQGQRIDPNRFNTGTLTEEAAKATADSEFDAASLSRNIANPFAAAYDTVVGLPAAVLQNALEFGKSKITGNEPEYVTSAPAQTALFEREPSVGLPSIAGRRGLGGVKEAQNLMLQDATPLTQAQLDAQASKVNLAERRANPLFDFRGRNFDTSTTTQITDPAEIARLEATSGGLGQAAKAETLARAKAMSDAENKQMTGEIPTVDQQVAQTEQAAKTIAGDQETTTVNTQRSSADAAAASEDVGVDAPAEKEKDAGSFSPELQAAFDAQYAELAPQTYDDFEKTAQQFMPETEFGEYRKKVNDLLKDREGTMKRAKKDSFSMALVQAGLGLMAQGGGQTALQALGKAAMPAVSQYAKDIKDLKKEDRELLQLGLSLEQMDAKEKAATKRMMYQMYTKQEADKKVARAGMLKTRYAGEKALQAQRIVAEKPTDLQRRLEILQLPADDPRRTALETLMAAELEKAKASATVAAGARTAVQGAKTEADINKAVANERSRLFTPTNRLIADSAAKAAGMSVDDYLQQELNKYEAALRGTSGQTQQGTPLPANPTAATLQAGTVYQTSRGPARWNGTQFELVQ